MSAETTTLILNDTFIKHQHRNCSLEAGNHEQRNWCNFLKLLQSSIVVSHKHPSTKVNFPSKYHIQREISRHVSDNYWYIIHPNSILKLCWDVLMMAIFYLQLMFTMLSYSFIQEPTTQPNWCYISIQIFDFYCFLNILMKFFIGFQPKAGSKVFIFNQRSIIKNYLRHSFMLDLLTALPVGFVYSKLSLIFPSKSTKLSSSVLFHIIYWIKLTRCCSFCNIFKIFKLIFCRIGIAHLKCQILLLIIKTLTSIHIVVCALKLVYSIIKPDDNPLMRDLNSSLLLRYLDACEFVVLIFFGCSIMIPEEEEEEKDATTIEEKLLISIAAMVGLCFNVYFLTQIFSIVKKIHSTRMKYLMIMNQLDAYAQKKQLPIYVQKRLQFYFDKKFRSYYFNEEYVTNLLSESLKKEILLNTGELFVKNFRVFDGVPREIFIRLFSRCRKEYFLPNDIIFKAGSVADCLFFIGTGTVCVSTANGKEVYHLGEGEYFGFIGFSLKSNKRMANVMAIEYCEIYVVDYKNFKNHFQANETIMQRMQEKAQERMKVILQAEEFQRKLFDAKIALGKFE